MEVFKVKNFLLIISIFTSNFFAIKLLVDILTPRYKKLKTFILIYISLILLIYIPKHLIDNNFLKLLISNITYLFIMLYFFKDKLSKKISVLIFSMVLMLLPDLITSIIMLVLGFSPADMKANLNLLLLGFSIFHIITITFYFLIYKKLVYIYKTQNLNYSYSSIFVISIQLVTSIIFISMIMYEISIFEKNVFIILISFNLLFFLSSFLYLKNSIYQGKNKSLNAELLFIEKQSKLQLDNYKYISEQITETRKTKHDLANHFMVLDILLNDKKYIEANKYLHNLIKNSSNKVIIYCENSIVNAIFHNKLSQNTSNKYTINIDIPQDISIKDIHLSSLFSNLLDNAINSCNNINNSNKIIIFNAWITNNVLNIHTSNTIGEKTKYDSPQNHGYGLIIIDEIVNNYGGICKRFIEDNTFYTEIKINL